MTRSLEIDALRALLLILMTVTHYNGVISQLGLDNVSFFT